MEKFGSIFAALYVAHMVCDHWVQTDHEARCKALKSLKGHLVCLWHAFTHVVVSAAFLAVLALYLGWSPEPNAVAFGLAVILVTHYIADRRAPLEWMARMTQHKNFVNLGKPREGRDDNPSLGTGMYALDQSWHIFFLGVAAFIMAV